MESDSELLKQHAYRKTSYSIFVLGCILLAVAAFWGIDDNPPAILSMLLGLFLLALGIIYFFDKSEKRKPAFQLLYWAPRMLSIVFALFISMFALDVFGEGRGLLQTLLALFMHLIPTFLFVIMLVISWRREWIAGLIFPLLGLLYILWAWGRPFAVWSTLALVAGPPVLTGILFLLNWHYRTELRK